jgi:hypothetical protein
MSEERITKKELMKMYNIDRVTVEVWREKYGLPIIEISTHSKYVRREDLINWENQMVLKNKLKDV